MLAIGYELLRRARLLGKVKFYLGGLCRPTLSSTWVQLVVTYYILSPEKEARFTVLLRRYDLRTDNIRKPELATIWDAKAANPKEARESGQIGTPRRRRQR